MSHSSSTPDHQNPADAPQPLGSVLACIESDRQAGRIEAWSWSTVIDENVGEAVIDRDLFERIHDAGGVNARFPVGNAGLIHVYGYLFSTVLTPYGYKRDRWNDGVLARSLRLPERWFRLGDSPRETPLERALAAGHAALTDSRADAREWSVAGVTQRAVVTPAADGPGVLTSGVDDGSGMRLLTLFPVADAAAFARDIGTPTTLRWNAATPPAV